MIDKIDVGDYVCHTVSKQTGIVIEVNFEKRHFLAKIKILESTGDIATYVFWDWNIQLEKLGNAAP